MEHCQSLVLDGIGIVRITRCPVALHKLDIVQLHRVVRIVLKLHALVIYSLWYYRQDKIVIVFDALLYVIPLYRSLGTLNVSLLV